MDLLLSRRRNRVLRQAEFFFPKQAAKSHLKDPETLGKIESRRCRFVHFSFRIICATSLEPEFIFCTSCGSNPAYFTIMRTFFQAVKLHQTLHTFPAPDGDGQSTHVARKVSALSCRVQLQTCGKVPRINYKIIQIILDFSLVPAFYHFPSLPEFFLESRRCMPTLSPHVDSKTYEYKTTVQHRFYVVTMYVTTGTHTNTHTHRVKDAWLSDRQACVSAAHLKTKQKVARGMLNRFNTNSGISFQKLSITRLATLHVMSVKPRAN